MSPVTNGDQDQDGASSIECNALAEEPIGLNSCSLYSALEFDPRPTFILDLEAAKSNNAGQSIPFSNAALRALPDLHDALRHKALSLTGAVLTSGGLEEPLVLCGRVWEYYTIEGRWRVVGSGRLHQVDETASSTVIDLKDEPGRSRVAETRPATQESTNPSIGLPKGHEQFMNQFDWQATDVGAVSTWSRRLQELFSLTLIDPRPAGIFSGPNHIFLYNEAYEDVLRDRHPFVMGLPGAKGFPDVWDRINKPTLDRLKETSRPVVYANVPIAYEKDNGFLEEFNFDWTSLPIFGDDGEFIGVYQSFSDVTQYNLIQRRTLLLSKMNAIDTQRPELDNIWDTILERLQNDSDDIPQVLMYSLSSGAEEPERTYCKLEGRLSCKQSIALEQFELDDQQHGVSQILSYAMSTNQSLYLSKRSAYGQSDLWAQLPADDPVQKLTNYLPSLLSVFETGPTGAPCDSVVVLPLRVVDAQKAQGFMIFELSPRQPYNEAYHSFVVLLQQTISAIITSVLLSRKRQLLSKAAEVTQADLSAQLLRQTKETKAIEARFSQLARHVPIGICIYRSDGAMAFANKKWYSLTDFSEESDNSSPGWWSPIVYPDDLPYAFSCFSQLQLEHQPVHFEIRLAVPSKQYTSSYTWVLVSAYPEMAEDNELESIVACFTDITEQKWAAEVERRRTEDALEAKRQQESFVDVTSHEIRNPLSVSLQCSEEISSIAKSGLQTVTEHDTMVSLPLSDLQDVFHAAEIIEQCTMHQKRIVDDILTLSKMEGGMLPFNTSPAQPLVLAENTLGLFGRELVQTGTKISFAEDPSFAETGVALDWLEFDQGRLSQMLINLMTNAIKFTKTQLERRIELRIGASNTLEPLASWDLKFLPLLDQKTAQIGADWDDCESVFIHFMVSDSGSGMSAEDQATIFTRFSQGSVKTYNQYGGSGLGLFICRSLVEIHGGQIGFRSTAGVGSSFGFCIKTRRITKPETGPSEMFDLAPIRSSSVVLQSESLPGSTLISTLDHPTEDDDSKYYVMIVEDNIINQRVLRKQLHKAGHIVTVANNGKECLDLLADSRFCKTGGKRMSVLLMDIEMPIMNGIDCTEEIRSMERDGSIKGHVPIIATTGNARNEKVELIRNAGVDEVLLKPYSITLLLQLIRDLVDRKEGSI